MAQAGEVIEREVIQPTKAEAREVRKPQLLQYGATRTSAEVVPGYVLQRKRLQRWEHLEHGRESGVLAPDEGGLVGDGQVQDVRREVGAAGEHCEEIFALRVLVKPDICEEALLAPGEKYGRDERAPFQGVPVIGELFNDEVGHVFGDGTGGYHGVERRSFNP